MQNVLDSMVSALLADKNRKFIYVEQARRFFFVLVLQISISLIFFWGSEEIIHDMRKEEQQ